MDCLSVDLRLDVGVQSQISTWEEVAYSSSLIYQRPLIHGRVNSVQSRLSLFAPRNLFAPQIPVDLVPVGVINALRGTIAADFAAAKHSSLASHQPAASILNQASRVLMTTEKRGLE